MEIKRGTPVSPGITIGPALVLDTEAYRIPQRFVPSERIDDEVRRFDKAIAQAAGEAAGTHRTVSDKFGPQWGAIFGAHEQLIQDPMLVREITTLIREHHCAAEYAVSMVMRNYAKKMESLGPGLIATRAADLYDIEKSILRSLLGHSREKLQHLKSAVVLLAHDLTPSETAGLDPTKVHAFATEVGGRASHTAIMAGALEIPAVVGLGKFITDVSGGDLVIVDGNRGLLIIDPDEETLARYEITRTSFRSFESGLTQLRDLPAETKEGTRITLLGNIEFPHEAEHCLDRGSDGVGLYRTEFLYLGRSSDPTEQEHLDAYLTVVRTLGATRPVVIRTLDVGADKFSNQTSEASGQERNPFLGLRSLRLCLKNLPLFKTQMRAILRASAFGNVRIMFPMVSTLQELRECKRILAEVRRELNQEGVPFNPRLPVGTMIEVPSAALMADHLAREVDFFSIGTNDLVQYTLAADRTNEMVAALYNPADPAVLRLIQTVVQAAAKQGITVNVCGEMSGEPIYTLLLLGMGLRQLSVTPHNIPEIKKMIRSVSLEEANRVASEALRLETARDTLNFLREQTRRILPEVVG